MKRLEYIYALLIAALFGWAISSCDDSGIITFDDEERAVLSYDNGETVKTTFTIGLSAPDVSADADIDAQTRALDNANIDYAQPENGGRFKNIVVLLVDHQNRIYGIHCKEFDNASGMKEYNVVFSNIDVPAADVTNKENYKVYAFGNVCAEHFTAIKNQEDAINENIRTTNINSRMNIYSTQIYNHCINATISHGDKFGNIWNNNTPLQDIPQYCLNFTPGSKYIVNNNPVTSTGMPENNSVTATVVKGNTQFNVALKRVCARIKITFRNFTGQYLDVSGNSVDNNIYIDEFKTTTNIFARSTKYLFDGNETYSAEAPFDILQYLNCKVNNVTASDHVNNKIENGKDITVSFYVFAVNLGDNGCKYNLKVDRGKSLGNRAGNLEDGNVYVMWNDNLDSNDRDFANSQNYCLGVSNNKIKLIPMNDPDRIPFGTSGYGNRVFWHYTGGKLESCNVNLDDDKCSYSTKFIKKNSGTIWNPNTNYPTDLDASNNAMIFTEQTREFVSGTRKRLKFDENYLGSYYMQISANTLYTRYYPLNGIGITEAFYPWVFFAKYIIIKPNQNQTLKDNKGTITKIERNHSYEFEFSVMPNYDTKQELLVNCVRRQNEVDWSETQK
ncbi:MAG: hypothetical protein J6Y11_13365 [Paludibacteraceae bacterium]|nr:hypothetical protein [Paludibacteraceae bacterium]